MKNILEGLHMFWVNHNRREKSYDSENIQHDGNIADEKGFQPVSLAHEFPALGATIGVEQFARIDARCVRIEQAEYAQSLLAKGEAPQTLSLSDVVVTRLFEFIQLEEELSLLAGSTPSGREGALTELSAIVPQVRYEISPHHRETILSLWTDAELPEKPTVLDVLYMTGEQTRFRTFTIHEQEVLLGLFYDWLYSPDKAFQRATLANIVFDTVQLSQQRLVEGYVNVVAGEPDSERFSRILEATSKLMSTFYGEKETETVADQDHLCMIRLPVLRLLSDSVGEELFLNGYVMGAQDRLQAKEITAAGFVRYLRLGPEKEQSPWYAHFREKVLSALPAN